MLDNLRTFIRHGKQAAAINNANASANANGSGNDNCLVDLEKGTTGKLRQRIGAAGPVAGVSAAVATAHPAAPLEQDWQQPHTPKVHHVKQYEPMARDLVELETKQEEEIKQQSRRSIQRYKIEDKLGDGAFSTVYRAVNLETGEEVAVKVIRKAKLDEKQRASVLKEVALMRGLDHPNIVRFLEFIENEQCYYIVQELVKGGELFNQVVKFTYLSEDLSRHAIIQVAEAILYLHEVVGVVHRDLKPENIFFNPIPVIPSPQRMLRRSDDPNSKVDEGVFRINYGGGGMGVIKIGDFGLSKQVMTNTGTDLKTPCGTIGYTAPEIVKDMRYSKQVDMWALGCVLYILLCGFPPFFNDSIEELTRKVAEGEYEFLSPWWDEISDGAKHCVSKLLTVNPDERYTIEEFMNDPWIIEFLQRSDSARAAQLGRQTPKQLPREYIDLPPIRNTQKWTDLAALPRYESTTVLQNEPQKSQQSQQPPQPEQAQQAQQAQQPQSSHQQDQFAAPQPVAIPIPRAETQKHNLHAQVAAGSWRNNDMDMYSPAVIAMREAMDISTAAQRQREEDAAQRETRVPRTLPPVDEDSAALASPLTSDGRQDDHTQDDQVGEVIRGNGMAAHKPFQLNLDESSLLQRRRHQKHQKQQQQQQQGQ